MIDRVSFVEGVREGKRGRMGKLRKIFVLCRKVIVKKKKNC